MARIDKDEIARKMFDDGGTDDLMINAERSKDRIKLREEGDRFAIKKRTVQFIPIADIVRRSESQSRVADFDPDKYEEDKQLLESIRSKGVVTPIMVKEIISDDDDPFAPVKYELIYGHRRTSACKVLGYTTIPAQIVDRKVNSDEITMIENMGVRTLTAYERGREMDRYITRTGITNREFSEQTGYSQSRISELISAYRAAEKAPELMELYQDNHIYSKHVSALVDIYVNSDADSKKVMLEKLPQLTQKQTKELIEMCAIGGSPLSYFKVYESNSVPMITDMEASNSEKKQEPGDPKGEPASKNSDDADILWNRIEKSRNFARKTAALYDCQQKDVKDAAQLCRNANLNPNAIKLILLGKKNGKKTDEAALETIRTAMRNPNIEKAASLYLSAYEKAAERKNAIIKQIDSLDDDAAESLKKLLF